MAENIDMFISAYFRNGLSINEMCTTLQTQKDISVSQRTVKRRLRSMMLFRRKNFTGDLEIASFLEQQLQCSGQMHGYK